MENCSLQELEVAMKCTPREQDALRFRAIRALWIETAPESVAPIFQVTLPTLRRWVRDFNDYGIDGLIELKRAGRPRVIPEYLEQPLRGALLEPQRVGETHWTAKKFHGYIRQKLDVKVSYPTVVRFLHRERLALKSPRPWPDRQDEKRREKYLHSLAQWLLDPNIELWYGDESGFEGDPRPRKRWVPIGTDPVRIKNGDHLRMNALGMVAPRTGQFFAIEATGCDTDVFQAFLDEAQKFVSLERKKNFLILDNASWHKTKAIKWGKFTPIYLPPYSPDFNPIERLWLLVKNEFFSDFVAKSIEKLQDRLDEALNWLSARADENQQTCAVDVSPCENL